MVSTEQDVRHFPAIVVLWTRVNRGSQKAVLEAVAEGTCLVPKDSRNKSHESISQNCSSQFATAKHVIPDADFQSDDMVAKALVNAFVVPADHQEVARQRQLVDTLLFELLSIWSQENDFIVRSLSLKIRDGVMKRLHGEHHASCGAKRCIIDFVVFVGAPLTEVMYMHLHEALVDATLDDAFSKRPTQESGEDCQDVDAHGSKVRGNFAVIMREKKDYRSVVSHPYQVFNGIFLTLPLDGIRQTGLRVPLLQEACEMGLERGATPHEILSEFLQDQGKNNAEDGAALLFRIIQYIERQVVLVDALEDARYAQLNDMGGAESLPSLMQRVRRHGLEDEMRTMLSEYAVRVVLTSHPTQFYPGHVLAIITDLALAMEDNDLVNIRKRLHQLGLTPFFQSEPPTPYEEAIRQIWYLENVFFEACSSLGARVASALGRSDGAGLNNGMLRIGFWPGGDRDGNPYVGADTTLRVARKLKLTLLRCYKEEFRELRRLVTFKGVEGELDMLQGMIEEAIFNPSDLSLKQDLLLQELGCLEKKVEAEFNGLYLDQIRQLMFKVRMFGLHFASIDIRQDARVVTASFKTMLEARDGFEAVARFEAMDESEAMDFLFAYNDVFEGDLAEDRHQDVLESLRAMQDIQLHNGEEGCHRYILSNCSRALDIATLYAMAKASGWEGTLTMDLVPLFESIQDLDGAREEMSKLYAHPVYAEHLDNRGGDQTVMLGFSDGTKDGGYLRANWAIYRAKQRLTDVSREYERTVMFFDGRGGPPARGGGNTHRFYASLGRDIENREIQTTIQGQTISSNFGIPKSAGFNLELLFTAGVKNRLFDEEETRILPEDEALLDELGSTSHAHYLGLRNRPEFTDYLATFGTLRYYGETNIGSRPTSRDKNNDLNFNDVRAIPFVGSWSQLKQNVPGYFGLGTALEALDRDGRLDEAASLYRRNAFFRTLVENSMQSMMKCDFRLTAHLASHPRFGALWNSVHEEYERTRILVLAITGQHELMETAPSIRESIRLRDSIIMPLLVIQQFALTEMERQQSSDAEADSDWTPELLRKLIIRTMYGIVNASRNAV